MWLHAVLWVGAAVGGLAGIGRTAGMDVSGAVVVVPPGLSAIETEAVRLLREEVEKRTGLAWPVRPDWPGAAGAVIALVPVAGLAELGAPRVGWLGRSHEGLGAEGYRLCATETAAGPTVFVLGRDPRGLLFGAGRLLRELRLSPGRAVLPGPVDVVTTPRYALRGHQLGYRPKTNSYDAWDVPQWEQYLRDLVVFGCNAIELIPPRSDDDPDSPHFPRPPREMLVAVSGLAQRYGLDVWLWYPALDRDYTDPRTVDAALREWGEVFRSLPRLDAVFVPGGDPGHTPPRVLFSLLERQADQLRRIHPRAQWWVSPQGFGQGWRDEFFRMLRDQPPAWLTGVVFGPQVSPGLAKLRQFVPARYGLRHYPDITHTRQCQFAVPDWDVALAVTEARECINPRPEDEAAIFRATQPYTVGFITYSEGCNDDVNKAVWSGLGWDPQTPVTDLLRDYSRYFIGERWAESFTEGLFGLERNWRGPLITNTNVASTLARFQAIERAAAPRELRNWRLQQALLRAYCDAYIQVRLRTDRQSEAQAMDCLRQARTLGPAAALAEAERRLARPGAARVAPELRERVLELGAALFQSIGMQLSVEKYRAIAPDRGAMLDTLEFPLNNGPWLQEQFARIRRLGSDAAQLEAVAALVDWENPGPGGFYDDLGNAARQPHLVRPVRYDEDPGALASPRVGFEEDLVVDEPDEKLGVARRVSWIDHAETLYDTPLEVRYAGLDPQAAYRVRVAYAGDSPKRKIRLVANGTFEIHPLQPKPVPFQLLEYDVPRAATAGGTLTLAWSGEPGLGGNGRGCQVSEVWLIRK
jgi:hypothetical protein